MPKNEIVSIHRIDDNHFFRVRSSEFLEAGNWIVERICIESSGKTDYLECAEFKTIGEAVFAFADCVSAGKWVWSHFALNHPDVMAARAKGADA